ncbi:CHAT domain-containing tetratricopeptide repeat protein [Rhodoferax sp.]|uniref:CHAT domain-containing protein n=1 Tax=Rhodoferax sp. TaxID=50421 RepID=UPI00283FD371|nr:CHAT domain-containing tetratricopeptide repeat protein [Rhodoferax sp.]MDR3370880.1 CHAT domain-containing protein [Rhodoferax sp.]
MNRLHVQHSPCGHWRAYLLLVWLVLALLAHPLHAQSELDDVGMASFDNADAGSSPMAPEEATRLLAQPLPDAPDARYAVLQRQYRAAALLEDRPRLIVTARQLVDAGRGRPGGESWITTYLGAEFAWGSSGKALEASEAFVTDSSLSLGLRAMVALRQTYFAAQGHDRAILARLWSRAEDLSSEALRQGVASPNLQINQLQVRSEIERWQGNTKASLATLRESIGVARSDIKAVKARNRGPRDPALLDAYGRLDGTMGMLTYALVRDGRPQEAIHVAQANLALWHAGQISDGLGARWNYRLAASLNATQQFAPALAAGQLSDGMLQRAGVNPASHTAWMARQEIVRALIGLRRWPEADVAYRSFLVSMPPDTLARTRASDWRLEALLAAKNGRLDEALELAERSLRYRNRLYGSNHPQTQEAAGIRGFVRLLRGDTRSAMGDYEALFAATLDNPGGWLDLDLRGVRGYVLGIAFDEFLHYVADKALKGEAVDAAMSDRALQLADRSSLSVTQRAITDSTARVLASTPALRALLDLEQTQRQAVFALVATLNTSLGEEDVLRHQAQSAEFKALSEAERKAFAERRQAVRDSIKTQQAGVSAARVVLTSQRETIAKQFPAYADLVTPSTPRPDQLRQLLNPGEALLVLYPTDNATLIWLLGADGRESFSAVALSRADLAQRVTQLRGLLDLGNAPAGQEPTLPSAQMYALYKDLLGPMGVALRDVHSLLVATDGPLASLPWAALVTQPPQPNQPPAWLVRQMAVTQLPASSALLALRRVAQPAAAAKALMGFGDPLFNAQAGITSRVNTGLRPEAARYDAEWGFRYADMPPLPDTRAELLALAAALGANPQSDLLLDSQATRRAVLDANLLDRRVVAFATHGLLPGELPGISKPSLAMAATSDERESPLLELDDVLGLRLNAQWVLLSACNTAAGEQGGAAMSGLVRGFFFAGARSVLATHWAVESESATALTSATFAAHAKGAVSRGESLRLAQLAMLDGTLGGGRWNHPFYWAPYALFGDPVR